MHTKVKESGKTVFNIFLHSLQVFRVTLLPVIALEPDVLFCFVLESCAMVWVPESAPAQPLHTLLPRKRIF